jgi:hypothetical protein
MMIIVDRNRYRAAHDGVVPEANLRRETTKWVAVIKFAGIPAG